MLDYLLSLVARQGTVWSESDHADMFMDGRSSLSQSIRLTVHNSFFFLFLNQNICCGYSKEPSQ